VLGVTDEGKKDTETWIKSKGAKYAYAYDKGGKLASKLGVTGIPRAFLVDPEGTVVWDGSPGELSDEIIERSLAGALPKPLYEFPAAASAVKSALLKRNYAAALAEAAKLSEADGGPELKQVIQDQVASRLAGMKSALEEGNLLTALDSANALRKDLDGLPEEAQADEVLGRIKADKGADRVMAAQRKIRALQDQRLGKRREMDKALADLDKLIKDFAGTYVAKEAADFRVTLVKRKNKS